MYKRYSGDSKIINNSDEYSEILSRKNLKNIVQYKTHKFDELSKKIEISNLNYVFHTWKLTDKIYNISYKYYSDASYGWAILLANNYASPFDIKDGSLIKIYFPLSSFLGLL